MRDDGTLEYHYYSYWVIDPEHEKEEFRNGTFDSMEIGTPMTARSIGEVKQLEHLVLNERYSPKARVVLISWQHLRTTQPGEPEQKRLLGELPPP